MGTSVPHPDRNFDDLDQKVEFYWAADAPVGGYTSPRKYARRNMRALEVVTSIDAITTGPSTINIFRNGVSFATITMATGLTVLITQINTPLVKNTDYLQWGLGALGAGAASFGIEVRGK